MSWNSDLKNGKCRTKMTYKVPSAEWGLIKEERMWSQGKHLSRKCLGWWEGDVTQDSAGSRLFLVMIQVHQMCLSCCSLREVHQGPHTGAVITTHGYIWLPGLLGAGKKAMGPTSSVQALTQTSFCLLSALISS